MGNSSNLINSFRICLLPSILSSLTHFFFSYFSFCYVVICFYFMFLIPRHHFLLTSLIGSNSRIKNVKKQDGRPPAQSIYQSICLFIYPSSSTSSYHEFWCLWPLVIFCLDFSFSIYAFIDLIIEASYCALINSWSLEFIIPRHINLEENNG